MNSKKKRKEECQILTCDLVLHRRPETGRVESFNPLCICLNGINQIPDLLHLLEKLVELRVALRGESTHLNILLVISRSRSFTLHKTPNNNNNH